MFIHKVDGLSDDDKMDKQRDIHQRANEDLQDAGLDITFRYVPLPTLLYYIEWLAHTEVKNTADSKYAVTAEQKPDAFHTSDNLLGIINKVKAQHSSFFAIIQNAMQIHAGVLTCINGRAKLL